jgi:predicted DNA-binding transcriptional regulator AlpA
MASRLLVTTEAAQRVRKPEATLRWWRHIGEGPPSFKVGRTVVYDEDELERWIAEQRDKQPA